MAKQETFLSCYRGNQNAVRHVAYMRQSKVLLIRHVLRRLGIALEGKRIFDYGFGAGTFFRDCPQSSKLFGVELDPVNVQDVSRMLASRGFSQIDLSPIAIETWAQHRLLQQKYDLVICSHVLEHIDNPVHFLQRLGDCLDENGLFVGLVPINERKQDPHHVRQMNLTALNNWLPSTKFCLVDWIETDSWLYWIQPIFTHESGFVHKLAQAISVVLGLGATGLGHNNWFTLSRFFGRFTGSKATQAAFVLRPHQRPSQKNFGATQ